MRAHDTRFQVFQRAQVFDDVAAGVVEEQLAVLGAPDRDNPFELIAILEQIVDGLSDAAARNSWTRTDQSLTSATLGDGGIYSSIEDLAKWDAALYGDRLLRPASLRLAFQPATPTDDPAVRYGFGWRITGGTAWHSGESIGFRNVIVRYLEQRFTVIVLTNRDDPPPYPAALAIAKLFL